MTNASTILIEIGSTKMCDPVRARAAFNMFDARPNFSWVDICCDARVWLSYMY